MIKKKDKNIQICLLVMLVLALVAGISIPVQKYREEKEQQRIEEEQRKEEERKRAEAEAVQKEKEAKIQFYLKEAEDIQAQLDDITDEMLCTNVEKAVQKAEAIKEQAASFETTYAEVEKEILQPSLELLETVREEAQLIFTIKETDSLLAELYDKKTDSVAMSTGKANRLFQEFQQNIWSVPDTYPQKQKQYEEAVKRISEEWHYVNDEWNYETATLKVSVEEKRTSYTRYWVCHIQTFSTQQLCSALSGGTYGNPRAAVSEELADHRGVIGMNGSGFSYGSGIPAPGKTMIKGGEIYNDVYSNGNIMCVTTDGGMFTAVAGMTAQQLLERGVRDTYCFGPTLVENGEAYEISGAFRETYRYQRSAVGMVSPGDYYIVSVDGKGASGSQGMNYEELQKIFLDLGCQYAYNLDGGGSTTLVFKGRVLNSLTDGRERSVADILYFIDVGDGLEGDEIIVHEDEAMLKPPSGS